jgi:hypothetical protein
MESLDPKKHYVVNRGIAILLDLAATMGPIIPG